MAAAANTAEAFAASHEAAMAFAEACSADKKSPTEVGREISDRSSLGKHPPCSRVEGDPFIVL